MRGILYQTDVPRPFLLSHTYSISPDRIFEHPKVNAMLVPVDFNCYECWYSFDSHYSPELVNCLLALRAVQLVPCVYSAIMHHPMSCLDGCCVKDAVFLQQKISEREVLPETFV